MKAGIVGPEYKTLKQRRDETVKALGYYPAKAAGAISFVSQVLPISMIAKRAKIVGAAASSIPAVQRLITAAVGGLSTGTAQVIGEKLEGEKFDLEKDLKKIPTHMLYWSLFEFGTLGAETAAKIVNWNLRYGPQAGTFWERMKTGKYGGYGAAEGVNVETQYAAGRGPTVRRDFTAAEIRDIFRRGDPSYTGPDKIGAGMWERDVYDSLTGASGWREALRRGWMSPRDINIPGEPPVITGYRTTRTGPVMPHVTKYGPTSGSPSDSVSRPHKARSGGYIPEGR